MTIALITRLGSAPQDLDAYFRFHLSAGVDVVVVDEASVPQHAQQVIDRYVKDGVVMRVGAVSHTDLARFAVDRSGAEWVILGASEEMWWPRGESLRDVLAAVPPRYGVVQALIRTFIPGSESELGSGFASRTVRTSLHGPNGSDGSEPEQLLRPIYRTTPGMTIDDRDWTLGGRRVPLRAWYPVEVFRFSDLGMTLNSEQLEAGLADGSLAVDTRLQVALASGGTSGFVVPTIVDDASYAVECAAVGEVDLVRLDNQIRELELRIAELEARFWPRVRHRLRRLARRPS